MKTAILFSIVATIAPFSIASYSTFGPGGSYSTGSITLAPDETIAVPVTFDSDEILAQYEFAIPGGEPFSFWVSPDNGSGVPISGGYLLLNSWVNGYGTPVTSFFFDISVSPGTILWFEVQNDTNAPLQWATNDQGITGTIASASSHVLGSTWTVVSDVTLPAFAVIAAPEPATWPLMLISLLAIVVMLRQRRAEVRRN